jgi:hypothetical protein
MGIGRGEFVGYMEHHLRTTRFEASRKRKRKAERLSKAGNYELMLVRIYSELQM